MSGPDSSNSFDSGNLVSSLTPRPDWVTDLGSLKDSLNQYPDNLQPPHPAPAPAAGPADASATVASAVIPRPPDVAEAEKEGNEKPGLKAKKLKKEIGLEFSKGVERFMLACKEALEKPDNLGKLEKFVDTHGTFKEALTEPEKTEERQPDTALHWNADFCRDVLGESHLSTRETVYAIYAFQKALNQAFIDNITHNSDQGYPFKDPAEGGKINAQTRIDGYLGAYTASALRYYVVHLHNKPAEKQQDWATALQTDNTVRQDQYNRAKEYLRGIFYPQGLNASPGSQGQRAPESLPEQYNEWIKNYLIWLKSRFSNVDEVVPFQTPDFQRVFSQVVRYGQQTKLNDWPTIVAGANLDGADQDIIFPLLKLKEIAPPAPAPKIETDVLKFKSADLTALRNYQIRDFYKDYLWNNYGRLKEGDKATGAWFTFRNFLEKGEFSNPSVQKAYRGYMNALAYHQANFTQESEEKKNKARDVLGVAIQAQQDSAEAMLHDDFERPACLPSNKKYMNKGDFEQTKKEISKDLPSPYNNQIYQNIPAHQALKPIYKILKEYDRDLAFSSYEELEQAAYPDLLQALWGELLEKGGMIGSFLDKTDNAIPANRRKMRDLFNAAIYARNVDRLRSALEKHFLPPEK